MEVELNSLEDAYLKIAEDEIAAHEEQKTAINDGGNDYKPVQIIDS